MTVYLNLPISVLKVVKNDEASSSFWWQYPFLQSQTVIIQASASKWAMSSGVLKWYGSLMIALFRFVGSKQMCSFKLPSLFLLYTSTKLLIQGVASCTGLSTPVSSILSTSCLNASLRWTGIGWQGVCLGVTLGSICIWYGGPGKLPIPSKTSGYTHRIWSLLVTGFGTCLGTAYFCLGILAATSCVGLWVDISCFCIHNVNLVSLGVIGWACYQASSGWKIVQSCSWLYQPNLVLGCINPSIKVVLQDNNMLPSFTATKNVTSINFLVFGWTK